MKSFETNWIRKKTDKTLPIPEIFEFPLSGCSGSYYDPNTENEIYTITGKPISMKYGVIVVGNKYDDNTKAGIIAHEWRHHMQYYRGIEYDEPKCKAHEIQDDSYDDMARKYFLTSTCEMDALRFEYKYTRFEGLYKPWEELFYDFIEDLYIRPTISYVN